MEQTTTAEPRYAMSGLGRVPVEEARWAGTWFEARPLGVVFRSVTGWRRQTGSRHCRISRPDHDSATGEYAERLRAAHERCHPGLAHRSDSVVVDLTVSPQPSLLTSGNHERRSLASC